MNLIMKKYDNKQLIYQINQNRITIQALLLMVLLKTLMIMTKSFNVRKGMIGLLQGQDSFITVFHIANILYIPKTGAGFLKTSD